MDGPLAGVRVLEFSEMIAAPFAGMHLGDMGADIIKVEPIGGDPWRLAAPFAPSESRAYLALNRNKRGLAVDLKSEAGQAVIRRLAPSMDVVIVNYRPDTAARLGIDYETLRRINARIIYLDNTFLGRRGPDAHRPGYDLAAQAYTGMLVTAGRHDAEGVPLPLTPAVADYATGLTITYAVCAALFARERTGVGQRVETTLLGTSLAIQGAGFMRTSGQTEGEGGALALDDLTEQQRRALGAYYRVYWTRDSMVAVACLTPALRRKMTMAIGVEDEREDRDLPRLSPEAIAIALTFTEAVVSRMLQKTTDEWIEIFDAAGVPASPVRHITDLPDDPQVLANDLRTELDHPVAGRITMVGPLVQMSETPLRARLAPPTLGQHNDEILSEFNYSPEEITRLRKDGVIR
jgi:formyl-CoA transferase